MGGRTRDDDLFREAMRRLGVTPVEEGPVEERATPARRDTRTPPPSATDARAAELGDAELQEALLRGPVPDKDADLARAAPPRRLPRPPRRAAARVDDRLDLHHLTADDALRRLAGFLAAARHRRLGTVLVITGRGRNSPGGVGVLRRRVDAWLRGPGAAAVQSFSPAPPRLGGDGAFLVHLRR